MQSNLFNRLEPIHVTDWKEFKNRFWLVLRGATEVGYISLNVNGGYSYNDLTQPLLQRTRIKLKAKNYESAELETINLLK